MIQSFFSLFRRRALTQKSDMAATINLNGATSFSYGDDLVISTTDQLDSDGALALLNTLKRHFPLVRIHLLCGFGQVQVQRNDGGGSGASGNDRRDPPLPVADPSIGKPAFGFAAAREQGDVSIITYVSGSRIVAVYIPPKKQSDSVANGHGSNPEGAA